MGWKWEGRDEPYVDIGGGLGRASLGDMSLPEEHADMIRDGFHRTTADVEQAVAERRFVDALNRVGNEHRHELLASWWETGTITPEELPAVIPGAWDHGARNHLDALGSAWWLDLFRAAGFVSSPERPAPTTETTVYRAQPEEAPELGMSWTSDYDVAAWFADRWEERDVPAVILTATAPPVAVLAMLADRNEHEIVVDPAMIHLSTEEG